VKEIRKKVVIADDNRELCDLLSEILSQEGYITAFVHDGFSLIII
jgi:CheY-like chemotaxis protein